jgi:4-hydroxy-2-oxovalerate aldolase
MNKSIKIVDVTLRDGMHAVSHQLKPEQMALIAKELENAEVKYIEFGHGNGLGGSSFQYGFSAGSDLDYIKAVTAVINKANLNVITLPGIGTRYHLNMVKEYGIKIAKFATQITEADISEEHIKMAKELGLKPIGGLTGATAISVEETVRQAKLMESYGAEIVYLYDGSGYLLPYQVQERISAMCNSLNVPIGFHAHNNLQLAIANTIAAIDAGAEYIDASLKGFGAGAGNCPTEVLVAVCERMGIETGIDLYRVMDVADKYLKPLMPRAMELDNDRIMLGYSGVYSSFLLFAQRAGEKYGVDPRDIIKEIGRRQCTEGQEDLCIQVAYDLAQEAN